MSIYKNVKHILKVKIALICIMLICCILNKHINQMYEWNF